MEKQAEAIIKLMRDFEVILCGACVHFADCNGRVKHECQVRYAEQARVMTGGKVDE